MGAARQPRSMRAVIAKQSEVKGVGRAILTGLNWLRTELLLPLVLFGGIWPLAPANSIGEQIQLSTQCACHSSPITQNLSRRLRNWRAS